MKFGVFVPQGWRMDLAPGDAREQWKAIVEVAQRAEGLGFDHLWVYDHFHTVPQPLSGWSVFEAWSTLAALAQLTDRIRLGQLVTCNLYRNPAYLAKLSSVLDVMSNGRLEFGVGAGWYEHEFKGYGYAFPKPSTRIAMLDEALCLIKRMWTEPVVDFEGEYYELKGALNDPKPIQKPHPPILVGGGGERRTLRVTATHADKADFGGTKTLDGYKHKVEVLKDHCDAIGRRFEEISLVRSVDALVLARSREEALDRFDRWEFMRRRGADFYKRQWGVDRELLVAGNFLGTPEQIVHEIEAHAELGVKELIAFFPYAREPGQLETFADGVMKQFE